MSKNHTAKYDTTKHCKYPYTPNDPLGYCWGYADYKDSNSDKNLKELLD